MSPNGICCICRKRIHGPLPLWKNIFHLVILYVVGIYELFRQLYFVFVSNTFLKARKESDVEFTTFQQVRPVVVLTGASSGIGYCVFHIIHLLVKEIILLMHPDDVLNTRGHIRVPLDLNSRDSVEHAVVHLRSFLDAKKSQQTILLIHCAGVYYPHDRVEVSYAESVQRTFAVNIVMFAVLLHRLEDIINAAVIIGSASQRCAPLMIPGLCPALRAASPFAAYPASKALLLTTSALWSRRTRTPTIVIHPGIVCTNLYVTEPGLRGRILRAALLLFAFKPEQAARRILVIVERACLLHPSAFSTLNIYWDAVTLQPGHLSANLCQKESAAFAKWFISELDL